MSNVDFKIYSSDFSTKFVNDIISSSSSIDDDFINFSTRDRKWRSSNSEDRRRLRKKRNCARFSRLQRELSSHLLIYSNNRYLSAIFRKCDMNAMTFSWLASFLILRLSSWRTWERLCSEKNYWWLWKIFW
jgi:hypothetical protein